MQQTDIDSLADQAWALVDASRFHEAHALFARLCELTPGDPEVWMMRGVTQMELDDKAGARLHLQRALELDSAYADPCLHLGKLALGAGHVAEALEYAKKALALDPRYAEAWVLLAAVQGSLNNHAEAENGAHKALSLDPESVQAGVQLAHALRAQNKLDEAVRQFRQILTRHPGLIEVEMELAATYARLAHYEQAAACYRDILARAPCNARAHNELGNAYMALDDHIQAERSYRQALESPDAAPEAYANLGLILQTKGDFTGAAHLCRQALARKPESAPLHQMLATVLEFLGQYDEAVAHCDLALSHDPGFTEVLGTRGRILIKQGDYQGCHALLKPLIQSGAAKAKAKLVFAEAATRLGQSDDTVNMLEESLLKDRLDKTERQQIHAALGRIYDETNRYDLAFAHFQQSNALKVGSFDLSRYEHVVSQLIATFNADFLSSAPRSQCASSLPVFIVGMPRSGTSLLEQVLASHRSVFGAGELSDIQELAGAFARRHAPVKYPQCLTHAGADELTQAALTYVQHLRGLNADAIRIVDKMPQNFMHLGLIQLLFPHARIIHVSRDPLDTCLSCYTQEFTAAHAYTYDLGVLGAYYKQYERLMQHWNKVLKIPILNVEYEALVNDQEAVSRQLIEFCELEWDERVLRFHETRRDVATASFDQVRQPLYKKSVQRWRHYEAHLGPLIAALEPSVNP
ncbi:MAG: sulfotransferase [Thiobacillus sp.]|uniref:tetratricopeptide repeat-containing sulfotransferase family protein n=1 Tax=Thiobacillus sp. TaxID=924 RepID=UPI0027349F22|nr:tetratricopeptide repeat-containing sulfotransferase family protein [Thiobacillus sp.]MDP3584462.1 sulfotransferase [Thiobacillus sp.]